MVVMICLVMFLSLDGLFDRLGSELSPRVVGDIAVARLAEFMKWVIVMPPATS